MLVKFVKYNKRVLRACGEVSFNIVILFEFVVPFFIPTKRAPLTYRFAERRARHFRWMIRALYDRYPLDFLYARMLRDIARRLTNGIIANLAIIAS